MKAGEKLAFNEGCRGEAVCMTSSMRPSMKASDKHAFNEAGCRALASWFMRGAGGRHAVAHRTANADVVVHARHAPVESTSGEAVSQTVGRLPGLHQNKHLRMDLWASRRTAGRTCMHV